MLTFLFEYTNWSFGSDFPYNSNRFGNRFGNDVSRLKKQLERLGVKEANDQKMIIWTIRN